MISAAVGRGGETMISAQTVEAFWNAVKHVKPLVGRAQLLARPGPDVPVPRGARGEGERGDLLLSERRAAQSALADRLRSRAARTWRATSASSPTAGLINIAGGCCGNTPEHIAAIAKALDGRPPRESAAPRDGAGRAPERRRPTPRRRRPRPLRLSGSQPFTQQPGVYMMIGERTNVAGSPKFAKLIKEGKYEEAVSVARQQVENGANVIDICMDEGMIDGVAAMTRFLLAARQRARGRQGPVHGRLLEVGGDRGRAQVPAGQGHRQLDLAQGRRGQVPRERARRSCSTAPRSS